MWKPAAVSVWPSGEKTTERSPAPIARKSSPVFASCRRTPPSPAAAATSDPSGETVTESTDTAGGA